jgi:DNA invertase Pin-like site-specific DNA recombinase
MAAQLVGYARVSTDEQDVTAQRDALTALGVLPERMYFDHERTGTIRDRPALERALEACWPGDTLVVTKLAFLARSIIDARNIADELAVKGVALSINGSVHDATDPTGRPLFDMLVMFAEFEADLVRARAREGMKVAAQRGRLHGGQPKLSPAAERDLVALYRAGDHSVSELSDLFSIARATVYGVVKRYRATDDAQLALPQVEDSDA